MKMKKALKIIGYILLAPVILVLSFPLLISFLFIYIDYGGDV